MSKPTFRRIFAYIIDVLIVAIISAALATLPVFKKYYTKYEENSNRYVELLNEASFDTDLERFVKSTTNVKNSANIIMREILIVFLSYIGGSPSPR